MRMCLCLQFLTSNQLQAVEEVLHAVFSGVDLSHRSTCFAIHMALFNRFILYHFFSPAAAVTRSTPTPFVRYALSLLIFSICSRTARRDFDAFENTRLLYYC